MSSGPVLSAKLSLEPLDRRDLLSVYTWTGMVNTDAANMSNWLVMQEMIPGEPPPPPPGLPDGDDELIFGPMAFNSRDCVGLTSVTDSFAAVCIQSGYAGTVALGESLTFGLFDLASGAISQPTSNTDLSITGTFTWTGGTLNNTPSMATVNVYGGGAFTLPASSALTTGSTLNFSSIGGASVTNITGAGNLILNGANPNAIFVDNNATVTQQSTGDTLKGLNSVTKTLVLNQGTWGYIGYGDKTEELRVVNNAGRFYISGPNTGFVTVKLRPGDANVPAYAQGNNPNAKLEIMATCELDVVGSKVEITGGEVWLIGNSLTGQNQEAYITGNYSMNNGTINFGPPVVVETGKVWVTFLVTGDVHWSGGHFNPGVNCEPNTPAGRNNWQITGTMTVDAMQPNKPTINPVPQFLPAGQQPIGTWSVISADKIEGNGDPGIPVGWFLLPEKDAGGVVRGYSVKK